MASKTSQQPVKAKKPSPPLTAYNLYFRHERTRLLSAGNLGEDLAPVRITSNDLREFMAKNPYQAPSSRKKRAHSKTHGAISFTALSRTVGQSWKALDAESKEPFQEVAYELKVAHYRKLEEERRRAKAQDKSKEKGEKPTPDPAQTLLVITKDQKASNNRVQINLKRTTISDTSPHVDAQALVRPRQVSLYEPPPAKKLKQAEQGESFASFPESPIFASFPEQPFIDSSPELSVDTILGDSSSDTGPASETLLRAGQVIEPIALRQNTLGGPPVLETSFADTWLMDSHELGCELTFDNEQEQARGGATVGAHPVLDARPLSPFLDLFTGDEMLEVSMGEMDKYMSDLMA